MTGDDVHNAKFQSPSAKYQINSKHQKSNFKRLEHGDLEFGYYLGFVI
jgi:hypothetical protein